MIWVNIVGFVLMALVVWWFWFWKPKSVTSMQKGLVEVLVDNGVYTPSIIEAKVGSTITLRFLRKDQTPCSSTVIFDDFGVSVELPINQKIDLTLALEKPGEFEFTCQMGMYRGRLLVLK